MGGGQAALPLDDRTVATPVTLAMIQALIPLGLKAVEDALLGEVEQNTTAAPAKTRSRVPRTSRPCK
jgi:hypothetical protein